MRISTLRPLKNSVGLHVVNQLLPLSLACFQRKITYNRSDFYSGGSDFAVVPQSAIRCSKLTIETLEQRVKYVQS